MSSLPLQELIKKVFSDEKTKQQFLSDPIGVLRQHNIADEEQQAALKVQAKLGLVTYGSQQMEIDIDSLGEWHAPEW